MKDLITRGFFDLEAVLNSASEGMVSSAVRSISSAVAQGKLEMKKTDGKIQIMDKAIKANESTRQDIMKTIREPGMAGKLTPELTQYLFAAYNQALIQFPF